MKTNYNKPRETGIGTDDQNKTLYSDSIICTSTLNGLWQELYLYISRRKNKKN